MTVNASLKPELEVVVLEKVSSPRVPAVPCSLEEDREKVFLPQSIVFDAVPCSLDELREKGVLPLIIVFNELMPELQLRTRLRVASSFSKSSLGEATSYLGVTS